MKTKAFRKKVSVLFLALAVLLGSGVVSGAANSLVLDPSRTIIYQNIEAESILNVYGLSEVTAQRTYDGKYYVVYGELCQKSSDRKSFQIQGKAGGGILSCESAQAVSGLADLQIGDRVKIYGKIVVTVENSLLPWTKTSITLATQKAEKAVSSQASASTFTAFDGTSKSRDSMKERSVADGKFVYYIPEAWTAVETELPNVEGYQYKLNALSGKGEPESLFLFYVDGRYLERSGDITKKTQVQKAIIRDILGNDRLKFRHDWSIFDRDISMSQIKADYREYTGYFGWYTDPNRRGRRVEFLFLPSEESEGIRVLLYVYNSGEHVEDILFLLRMI